MGPSRATVTKLKKEDKNGPKFYSTSAFQHIVKCWNCCKILLFFFHYKSNIVTVALLGQEFFAWLQGKRSGLSKLQSTAGIEKAYSAVDNWFASQAGNVKWPWHFLHQNTDQSEPSIVLYVIQRNMMTGFYWIALSANMCQRREGGSTLQLV